MQVHFGQIYIRAGISFPFSFEFQHWLSHEISDSIEESARFIKDFGGDSELTFRISAKTDIDDVELAGPTVFAADKHVEYTIFVPFSKGEGGYDVVVDLIIETATGVLESLGFDVTSLEEKHEAMLDEFRSRGTMLDE